MFLRCPVVALVCWWQCLLPVVVVVNGDCAMFGLCDVAGKRFCKVDVVPQPNDHFELENMCGIHDKMACCDVRSMEVFGNAIKQLQYLSKILVSDHRCYYGILSILCDITCSKSQSDYVEVIRTDSGNSVMEINANITSVRAESVYDMCKGLVTIIGSVKDYLCSTKTCDNAKEFFGELGHSVETGGKSPYQINFNLVGETGATSAHSITTQTPVIENALIESPDWINSHPMWFSMIMVFCLLSLLFVGTLLVTTCLQRRRSPRIDRDEVGSTQSPMKCSSMGVSIQLFIAKGALVARFPWSTIFVSLITFGAVCCGFIQFQVTTDPVDLWSDPSSRVRLEKDHFDRHFGPFFRIEQLIIEPVNTSLFTKDKYSYGPVFRKEFLKDVLDLQTQLTHVTVKDATLTKDIKLSDICHKPLFPKNEKCGIFTPLEYFQNNQTLLDLNVNGVDYLDHIDYCSINVASPMGPLGDCLATSGMPMFRNVVFGGFEGTQVRNASAVVVTFLVNGNSASNSQHVQHAKAWELQFIHTVEKWKAQHPQVTVNFITERSAEDEIDNQSHSDMSTVIISYAIMFIYVSLFLGNYRTCRTVLVDIKLSLSIGGLSIVLVSVLSSVGLWSFVGIPASLIIVEVIPFVVLAVGVDNIFILVQDFSMHAEARNTETYDSNSLGSDSFDLNLNNGDVANPKRSVKRDIAQTMGRIGPSMLLSSLTESVAFFCGAMTSVPAVRVFAIYAGSAIMINFFLQIFTFVALLTLDARRTEANRVDVLCCIEINQKKSESNSKKNSQPWLYRFVAHCLAPVILSKWLRAPLMIIFIGWMCFCAAIIPGGLIVGLDPELSMSVGSHPSSYLKAMPRLLAIGPPVFFVVTGGHEVTTSRGQNQICSSLPSCNSNSLVASIKQRIGNATFGTSLSDPIMSWIDEYTMWSSYESCCGVSRSDPWIFCNPRTSPPGSCLKCPQAEERFNGFYFNAFLANFLDMVPDEICPLGGRSKFKSAISFKAPTSLDHRFNVTDAFYIQLYHTVMRKDSDIAKAFAEARQLADDISNQWAREDGVSPPVFGGPPPPNTVYAYSPFYVFYEQYLTIQRETLIQLSTCLVAITAITFFILGFDVLATLNIVIGVTAIVLSLAATMVLWEISLNAISLVNLVVCAGISVEFCAHIVRTFAISLKTTRVERSLDALAEMGSAVLRGVTMTKFGGIIVLAFAKSRLFRIFYFRMYLSIVIFGALVGIIFLPVLLSYIGPGLNKALVNKTDQNQDNEFEELEVSFHE